MAENNACQKSGAATTTSSSGSVSAKSDAKKPHDGHFPEAPPSRGKSPEVPPRRGKSPDAPPRRGKSPEVLASRGKSPDAPPRTGKSPEVPPTRGKSPDVCSAAEELQGSTDSKCEEVAQEKCAEAVVETPCKCTYMECGRKFKSLKLLEEHVTIFHNVTWRDYNRYYHRKEQPAKKKKKRKDKVDEVAVVTSQCSGAGEGGRPPLAALQCGQTASSSLGPPFIPDLNARPAGSPVFIGQLASPGAFSHAGSRIMVPLHSGGSGPISILPRPLPHGTPPLAYSPGFSPSLNLHMPVMSNVTTSNHPQHPASIQQHQPGATQNNRNRSNQFPHDCHMTSSHVSGLEGHVLAVNNSSASCGSRSESHQEELHTSGHIHDDCCDSPGIWNKSTSQFISSSQVIGSSQPVMCPSKAAEFAADDRNSMSEPMDEASEADAIVIEPKELKDLDFQTSSQNSCREGSFTWERKEAPFSRYHRQTWNIGVQDEALPGRWDSGHLLGAHLGQSSSGNKLDPGHINNNNDKHAAVLNINTNDTETGKNLWRDQLRSRLHELYIKKASSIKDPFKAQFLLQKAEQFTESYLQRFHGDPEKSTCNVQMHDVFTQDAGSLVSQAEHHKSWEGDKKVACNLAHIRGVNGHGYAQQRESQICDKTVSSATAEAGRNDCSVAPSVMEQPRLSGYVGESQLGSDMCVSSVESRGNNYDGCDGQAANTCDSSTTSNSTSMSIPCNTNANFNLHDRSKIVGEPAAQASPAACRLHTSPASVERNSDLADVSSILGVVNIHPLDPDCTDVRVVPSSHPTEQESQEVEHMLEEANHDTVEGSIWKDSPENLNPIVIEPVDVESDALQAGTGQRSEVGGWMEDFGDMDDPEARPETGLEYLEQLKLGSLGRATLDERELELQCERCARGFHTAPEYVKHLFRTHPLMRCAICLNDQGATGGQVYRHYTTIQRHLVMDHNINEAAVKDKILHSCYAGADVRGIPVIDDVDLLLHVTDDKVFLSCGTVLVYRLLVRGDQEFEDLLKYKTEPLAANQEKKAQAVEPPGGPHMSQGETEEMETSDGEPGADESMVEPPGGEAEESNKEHASESRDQRDERQEQACPTAMVTAGESWSRDVAVILEIQMLMRDGPQLRRCKGVTKDAAGKDVRLSSPQLDGTDTPEEEAGGRVAIPSPVDDVLDPDGTPDKSTDCCEPHNEGGVINPATAQAAAEMGTNQSVMQSAMEQAKMEMGGKVQPCTAPSGGVEVREAAISSAVVSREEQGRELFKMLTEAQQKEQQERGIPAFQPKTAPPERQISLDSDLEERPLVIAEGSQDSSDKVKSEKDLVDTTSHLCPKKKFLKGLQRSQSDNNMSGMGTDSRPESRSGSFSYSSTSNSTAASPGVTAISAVTGTENKEGNKPSEGVNLRDYFHKIMESSIQNQLGKGSASPKLIPTSSQCGPGKVPEVTQSTDSPIGRIEALACQIPGQKSPSPCQPPRQVEPALCGPTIPKDVKEEVKDSYPIFYTPSAVQRSEPPPLIKTKDLRQEVLAVPTTTCGSSRGFTPSQSGDYSNSAAVIIGVKSEGAAGASRAPVNASHGNPAVATTLTHSPYTSESPAANIRSPWPYPGVRDPHEGSITHGRPISYGQVPPRDNVKREPGPSPGVHQTSAADCGAGVVDTYAQGQPRAATGQQHHSPHSQPRAAGQCPPHHAMHGNPLHTRHGTQHHATHGTPHHATHGTQHHATHGTPHHATHGTPHQMTPQLSATGPPQQLQTAGTSSFRQASSHSLGLVSQTGPDYRFSIGPAMQGLHAPAQKSVSSGGAGGHVTVSASIVWPPRAPIVLPPRSSPGSTRVRSEGPSPSSSGLYGMPKHPHAQHHSAPPSPHHTSPRGQQDMSIHRFPSPGQQYSPLSQISPTGSHGSVYHPHLDVSQYSVSSKISSFVGTAPQLLSPVCAPQISPGCSNSRSREASPHHTYSQHSARMPRTPTPPHSSQHGAYARATHEARAAHETRTAHEARMAHKTRAAHETRMGHETRILHESRPSEMSYRTHLEPQPFRAHPPSARSPASIKVRTPVVPPSVPLTGSSSEAPLDLSVKRKSSELGPDPVSPHPSKSAKTGSGDSPLDLTVKKEEAVKPFVWRPTGAVGPMITKTADSTEHPAPGVSTHIKSLEASMTKHIQTMQHARPPYIPGCPTVPPGLHFAHRQVAPESAVRPTSAVFSRPPVSLSASVSPSMPPPPGGSRVYNQSTDPKMPPSHYGKPVGSFLPSQPPKPAMIGRAEPYIVRPSVAPMRPNPPRQTAAGHVMEAVSSAAASTTGTSTRVSSGGNRMSITAMLLGNHPIDDILYLKCNVCNSPTATYGSLHSFRKHFNKTHGFDPKPEHVTIRSISEAKDRGARTVPSLSGPAAPPPSVEASMMSPIGVVPVAIAPIPIPEIKDHINRQIMMPSPKPIRDNSERDSPKKPSSPSESSEDSSLSDEKMKETVDPTGQSTMRCLQCGQDFPTRDWGVFKRHVRAHDFPQLRCNICRQTFQDADELKTHNSTYHQTQACVCRICDVGFAHPGALNKHMKTAHQSQSPMEGEFRCMYCPMIFKQQQMWFAHLTDHERGVCIPRISPVGGSGSSLVRRATPDSTNEMEHRKPPVLVIMDEESSPAGPWTSGPPAGSQNIAVEGLADQGQKEGKEPKEDHARDDSETMTLGRTIFQIITEKVEQESRRQFAELEKARMEAQRLKSTEVQIQTENNVPFSESGEKPVTESQALPSPSVAVSQTNHSVQNQAKSGANFKGRFPILSAPTSEYSPILPFHPVHPKRKGYNPAEWAAKAMVENNLQSSENAACIEGRTSSHVESSTSSVEGSTSHVEGSTSPVEGSKSHVEGSTSPVEGSTSHSESSKSKPPAQKSRSSYVSAGEALDMLLKQAFMSSDPQDTDDKPQPILARLRDPGSPTQDQSTSAMKSPTEDASTLESMQQDAISTTAEVPAKLATMQSLGESGPAEHGANIQHSPQDMSVTENQMQLDKSEVNMSRSGQDSGADHYPASLAREDVISSLREKNEKLLTAEDFDGSTDTSLDAMPTAAGDCTQNSSPHMPTPDSQTSVSASQAELIQDSEKDQDAECADINTCARSNNPSPAAASIFRGGDDPSGKRSSRSPLPSRKSTRPHVPPERFRFSQYETGLRGIKRDSLHRFSGESDSESDMNAEKDISGKGGEVTKAESTQEMLLEPKSEQPGSHCNRAMDTADSGSQCQLGKVELGTGVCVESDVHKEAASVSSSQPPTRTQPAPAEKLSTEAGNISSEKYGPNDLPKPPVVRHLKNDTVHENSVADSSVGICDLRCDESTLKRMEVDVAEVVDAVRSSSTVDASSEVPDTTKVCGDHGNARPVHGSRSSTPRSSQDDSSCDGVPSLRKKQTARKSMAAGNDRQLSLLKRPLVEDSLSDDDQVSKRVRDCKVKLMDISHSRKFSDYMDPGKCRLPGDLAQSSSTDQPSSSTDDTPRDRESFHHRMADETGAKGSYTGYSSAPELPRRTRGRPRKTPLPGGATPPRQHSPASASDRESH